MKGCLVAFLVIALIIIGVAVVSFGFMWAWNGFAVMAFGLPVLDLGTAFAGFVFFFIIGSFFRSAPNVPRAGRG
jgi:hypothetical protein